VNSTNIHDVVSVLFRLDAYKLDHRRQYPDKTEYVQSNWTPRGTRIEGITKVVEFGLQRFIIKFLEEAWAPFFALTEAEIDAVCAEYERQVCAYLFIPSFDTSHIRDLWELGYLPLRFSAVPEGTALPLRVPSVLIENTHPGFGWVTNSFETLYSDENWLACTSATTAKRLRDHLDAYAKITGSPPEFVDWQGHDFSMRGMQGLEAAATSGMAHLLYFTGSDTLPAMEEIRRYYGGYPEGYLITGSVPATEHSVMCAGMEWITEEYEVEVTYDDEGNIVSEREIEVA